MLELRTVSKGFGSTRVLSDLSFTLGDGEIAALCGPSGSGKTTVLRLISGLELPDQGEIHIDGRLASRPKWGLPPHQRQIGCVFQEPRLWPHMTVRGNIEFALAGWSRNERRARLDQAAQWTGLANLLDRHPAGLSGGEARRVALARALAPRRKLVLMDEPLTNLDASSAQSLLDAVLQAWREEKFSLLYVTHDPAEMQSLDARILTI
jgi:iron(III) transport system ATP-binding protein